MSGFFNFIGAVIRPLLTLLVSVLGLAFIASVLSPQADDLIERWLPAWSMIEPAKDTVREWLGIGSEPERAWWHFWGRD